MRTFSAAISNARSGRDPDAPVSFGSSWEDMPPILHPTAAVDFRDRDEGLYGRVASLYEYVALVVAATQRWQIATCLNIGKISAAPTRMARGRVGCRRYIQAGADHVQAGGDLRGATAATRASSLNPASGTKVHLAQRSKDRRLID